MPGAGKTLGEYLDNIPCRTGGEGMQWKGKSSMQTRIFHFYAEDMCIYVFKRQWRPLTNKYLKLSFSSLKAEFR